MYESDINIYLVLIKMFRSNVSSFPELNTNILQCAKELGEVNSVPPK